MKVKLTGRNAVVENLEFGTKFYALYIDRGAKGGKIKNIVNLAKKRKVPIKPASRKELKKLARSDHHQGVVGIIQAREYTLDDIIKLVRSKDSGTLVFLREVLYEQNLGAIMRTCEAAGVDGIVCSERGCAAMSAVVRRVSMGASERIPLAYENMYHALKTIRDEGVQLIGVETSGKMPYYRESAEGWKMYVFGGEDKGLSDQVLERCDRVVKIPMKGKVTSLNLSVSTAIILFDNLRRAGGSPQSKN